jgi:DNA-binding CsgD family transcriptional regulator
VERCVESLGGHNRHEADSEGCKEPHGQEPQTVRRRRLGRGNGRIENAKLLHVLTLLSKEPNTATLAQELDLAPGTIRSYLRTLRLKLRVDNRAQLVMVAQAFMESMQEETDGGASGNGPI